MIHGCRIGARSVIEPGAGDGAGRLSRRSLLGAAGRVPYGFHGGCRTRGLGEQELRTIVDGIVAPDHDRFRGPYADGPPPGSLAVDAPPLRVFGLAEVRRALTVVAVVVAQLGRALARWAVHPRLQ